MGEYTCAGAGSDRRVVRRAIHLPADGLRTPGEPARPGGECDLVDRDGNRLRVAKRCSWPRRAAGTQPRRPAPNPSDRRS